MENVKGFMAIRAEEATALLLTGMATCTARGLRAQNRASQTEEEEEEEEKKKKKKEEEEEKEEEGASVPGRSAAPAM